MEIILPNSQETNQINQQRAGIAADMQQVGSPEAALLMLAGSCSADSNRLPNGEPAPVAHLRASHQHNRRLEHVHDIGRLNGAKPRSSTGSTGLLHQPDGPERYTRMARTLTQGGVELCAETMDESDLAIATPWLTAVWIGTRNIADTGPRYLVRPTAQELDVGIHPVPVFGKNAADGSLDDTFRALHTIMSEKPETRTRMTLQGRETVATHANPHVGIILRGGNNRPAGNLEEAIIEEVGIAREAADKEFGKNRLPILLDFSHGHAKWEGGGAAGQLNFGLAVADLILRGLLAIDGVMMETYLVSGKQTVDGVVPGLSLTDECIGQADANDLSERLDKSWSESHQ